MGYEPKIIPAVEEVNRVQKLELVNMISDRFGESLKGFKFAIWGLSFKPQTDDMREAPSIVIIRELMIEEQRLCYDPEVWRLQEVSGLTDWYGYRGSNLMFKWDRCMVHWVTRGGKEFKSSEFWMKNWSEI